VKNTKQDIIICWTRIARNIILTICVPISIFYGVKLYTMHIGTLEAHIKLLKETQYDNALSLIKAQEELHQREKKKLENKIDSLVNLGSNNEEINQLRRQLDKARISQEILAEYKKILKFNKKELLEYMNRQFSDLPSWDDL
jgi:histidyl-tRNA synthetase